jgi:hypothetical protein
MIKIIRARIFLGDVVGRGRAGSTGSGGASPYQHRGSHGVALNAERLRWGDDRDLNSFSCPGVFQYFRPILQCEFVRDDFVHFDLTALKIS